MEEEKFTDKWQELIHDPRDEEVKKFIQEVLEEAEKRDKNKD